MCVMTFVNRNRELGVYATEPDKKPARRQGRESASAGPQGEGKRQTQPSPTFNEEGRSLDSRSSLPACSTTGVMPSGETGKRGIPSRQEFLQGGGIDSLPGASCPRLSFGSGKTEVRGNTA
jgi:hypothetical protein